MSQFTYIIGIKPPDEKWKKMKAIWDSCKAAKIAPPIEVWEFFNEYEPNEKGVEVRLNDECCKEHTAYAENGFIVDLTKLPKDVTFLKFVNSY